MTIPAATAGGSSSGVPGTPAKASGSGSRGAAAGAAERLGKVLYDLIAAAGDGGLGRDEAVAKMTAAMRADGSGARARRQVVPRHRDDTARPQGRQHPLGGDGGEGRVYAQGGRCRRRRRRASYDSSDDEGQGAAPPVASRSPARKKKPAAQIALAAGRARRVRTMTTTTSRRRRRRRTRGRRRSLRRRRRV